MSSRRFNSSFCLGALLLIATGTAAFGAEPLRYLPAGQPDAAVVLAPPPLPGSIEQAADMAAVMAAFHSCTSNEAALAFSEKNFSAFTFTPAIGKFFQPGKFPKVEAFLERVQTEAETVTDLGKDFWKRPRPFTVDPSLASGKLETSFCYPSGHSSEGTVLALVLADLFPDQREAILSVGRNLGWHRVWIARHYPTDIYAGRVFAQAIVREMKKNPDFQRDFAAAKSDLAATQHASQPIPETATAPVAAGY